MKELLGRIKDRLDKGAYVNEASVRIGIIEPILVALGWDTSDPGAVVPEFASEGRRVDYALCSFPLRPAIFIEAKAVGRLEAADRQLFEYAFHVGVPFAVLTDGKSWSFYLPAAQGSYEERRLYHLDLQERTAEEAELYLTRYLSFSRVRDGTAQADAHSDHSSKSNARVAQEMLAKAWSELISEPDPLIIELLVDRAEQLCGIRPTLDSAEKYLLSRPVGFNRSIPAQETRSLPIQGTAGIEEGARARPIRRLDEQSARASAVSAQYRGKQLLARDATGAFLALLRAIIEEFPENIEQVATAARGRSRNHIANSVAEVYPNRPDLASSAVEISPGWFVGTNIANREKFRIIKAASEACGLRLGSDLKFELPNV
ncbi:MAG: hypothetical protein WBL74_00860 [Novosphingobium sp.]|uniref:hypothetical protein n=1 Tax=Novosphingobium sp. TaxID=1874826 RepID=UPI003C7E66D4